MPLVGDSDRAAATVIMALGIGACSVGAKRVDSALFGVLGAVAFVFGVLALVTRSLTPLSLLVADMGGHVGTHDVPSRPQFSGANDRHMTDVARSADGGSATVAGRRLPHRELAPTGLSEAEAERRLAAARRPSRPEASRSYASIVRANVLTVFSLILAVFGTLTLIFGDARDALFLGIIVANSTIGIVQEVRASGHSIVSRCWSRRPRPSGATGGPERCRVRSSWSTMW